MILNLFLCGHLKISSLHLFNCWLVNLNLMMLILVSSRKMSHRRLKLPKIEDFLMNFHFIYWFRPVSLKLKKHPDSFLWFLCNGLKKCIHCCRISFSNFQLRFQYKTSLPYYFVSGKYLLGWLHFQKYTFLSWDNLIYFNNYNVVNLFADYLSAVCRQFSCYDYKLS